MVDDTDQLQEPPSQEESTSTKIADLPESIIPPNESPLRQPAFHRRLIPENDKLIDKYLDSLSYDELQREFNFASKLLEGLEIH